jgi:drug/metabolite transporter (DMT)-like permease
LTTADESSSRSSFRTVHLPRLALLAQTSIAAGTFIVAKDATARFSPPQLAWFRIVLSFLVILPAYWLVRRRPVMPRRGDLLRLALLGLVGVAINQTLFLQGIASSTPRIWLGEGLTMRKGAGIALAFVGVALVLAGQGLDLATGTLRGDLLILVAVFAWSAYTLIGKAILRQYDPLMVNTWTFGFGALFMLPLGPWLLRDFEFATPGWQGWLGLAYLSVMTSGAAFTLWYWALKRLQAGQVAVFTNLQPPTTAFLAWLVFAYVPSWLVIFGGLLVMIGVTIAQTQRRAQQADVRLLDDSATKRAYASHGEPMVTGAK